MTNGHETTNGHATNGGSTLVKTRAGREIPHGASQVGVFDLVPKLGYREYWSPVTHDTLVKRKPIGMKMLGEDLVLFRDENNEVKALSDFCPHRGARLSGGIRRTPGGGPDTGKLNNEFNGYVTCPYHGYTFNGEGVCVAALTDGPNSGLVGKLRAPAYPTKTHRGVVWVWMGETEPVPLEDDLPYIGDEDYIFKSYVRRWDMSWTLTIENSQDSHDGKLHRGSIRRVWNLALFRKGARSRDYWGGSKITGEGDDYFYMMALNQGRNAFYPGVNHKWPQHTWWRFLTLPWEARSQQPKPGVPVFDPERKGGLYRLPAIASPGIPPVVSHVRYAVPITEDSCRMWTFTITRKAIKKSWWSEMWWTMHYHFWYTYIFMQGINEQEDLPVQAVGCLDPEQPQKLGGSDASTIYWRRRLPLRSRDYVRKWSQEKLAETAQTVDVTEDQEIESEPLEVGISPS